jgi:hypothetical protein
MHVTPVGPGHWSEPSLIDAAVIVPSLGLLGADDREVRADEDGNQTMKASRQEPKSWPPAFEVSGKLDVADFRDILTPAIERAAADGPMRVVVVVNDFHGLSAGALWEDLKLAAKHPRGARHTAVVTDIDWIHR